MSINYNEISKKYDDTRKADINIIKRLINGAQITKESVVIDFGCGTGNYTILLKEMTNAAVYGVEPSDGMRNRAVGKANSIIFLKGDHTQIPIESCTIDLIYMTEVIHHVPDINQMFKEFKRILKSSGNVCIVTESYKQIENRFWNRYFPSIVEAEKSRYPDIGTIIDKANQTGFYKISIETTDKYRQHKITPGFVNLVENKGFSMFNLISDEEYEEGLRLLKQDFHDQVELKYVHGETFIWFSKDK